MPAHGFIATRESCFARRFYEQFTQEFFSRCHARQCWTLRLECASKRRGGQQAEISPAEQAAESSPSADAHARRARFALRTRRRGKSVPPQARTHETENRAVQNH